MALKEIPTLQLALAVLRRAERRHERLALQGLLADVCLHQVRVGQGRQPPGLDRLRECGAHAQQWAAVDFADKVGSIGPRSR